MLHTKQSSVAPLLAVALALALAPLACSKDEPEPEQATSVAAEVNPNVDFSTYTSFAVVDPETAADAPAPAEYSQFKTEIETSIIDELTSKGLTHDSDNPQLLVNPLVSVDRVQDIASFYDAYWGWYYGYEYLWTVPVDYEVGTLLIDVIDRGDPNDAADDILVYRGTAEGLLAEDAEHIKLQLRNAIHAIFTDWPTPKIDD